MRAVSGKHGGTGYIKPMRDEGKVRKWKQRGDTFQEIQLGKGEAGTNSGEKLPRGACYF